MFFELSTVRASVWTAQYRMTKWPITTKHFSCEARAIQRVASVKPDLPVAQSDCQRFKFFSDSTHVIDLHGLNDHDIAHQPAPGSVTWGRYSAPLALSVAAPVWVWGYAWWSSKPMASIPLSRIVTSKELVRQFAGYFSAPSKEVGERMAREYTTVSARACGAYFNFLVRKEHAAAFRQAGMSVGMKRHGLKD
jgi:hypothetical protein